MKHNSSDAAYLAESLVELERAIGHLGYSARTIPTALKANEKPHEDQLIQIEAFTSRFARVVDLLSKRVLRAMDQFEMQEPGTLLDVANRAEKRRLIESVEWLREVKDTRNEISHDYAGDRLLELLVFCRDELPKLIIACNHTIQYGRDLLSRHGS